MSRPIKGEARSAILEAADRLFYRDGIRAVGVDLVAAEAGITKRTLYYHFPTKEALIDAYLSQRDQPTRDRLIEQAERFGPLPGDHILGIFDVFADWFVDSDWRGCPYLNAMAESGSKADAVCERVTEHKEALSRWITVTLAEAGAKDPQGLAEQLMLLIDGALSRSAYRGSEVARHARATAAALLSLSGVAISQPIGNLQ